MADKSVKFCNECDGNNCKECDEKFHGKEHLQTTTFHQINVDLTKSDTDSARMIVDLGCPNSVIGDGDVKKFIKSLSHYQQENLELIEADDKFKFGPSGPYKCAQKLRIPIGRKGLWVTVAVVNATIPMLLGNNLLKPLEAKIKLFSEGNGVVVLAEEEIELKETRGGHYTVKVSDLGKLCRFSSENDECDACEKESLHDRKNVSFHEETTHGNSSILKGVQRSEKQRVHEEIVKDIEGDLSMEKVITDLNTFMNKGKPTTRDKELVKIMKKIARLKTKCEECEYEKANSEHHHVPEHKIMKNNPRLENECNECEYQETNDEHLHHQHRAEHETESIFLSHHDEDFDVKEVELSSEFWNIFLSEDDGKELSDSEKKEILKLHKFFAHRNGRKLWDNLLQPSGRLRGKKRLVVEFLDKCKVCAKYRKTPSRPKVGLPKSKDVNDVVSIDLKIIKKAGNKEVAILYLHDEFSKLIKGQVIDNKKPDTIIKAIENKWIVGGGSGPGHPSRGFFADNGGEFLNSDLIDFAAALDISIRMTAAASPWMNGGCERSHATVDRIVDKILEDDPQVGLQKAVDLACFVKNTEINKSGFSPLQLLCGKSPHFPGYSDSTPGTIELDGSNEYLKVLKRIDTARVAAREIDCNQRIKIALKSQINPSLERSYDYGESIWFKLDSSKRWKSGKVLGQDGKVLFIKYGNFIRRVPLDRIVPAQEYVDDEITDVDQEDVNNQERLEDDDFDNVDIVAQKDIEIANLKTQTTEYLARIDKLEKDVEASNRMENKTPEIPKEMEDKVDKSFSGKMNKSTNISLPNKYKSIRFKMVGNDEWFHGKVLTKHKGKSIHKKHNRNQI